MSICVNVLAVAVLLAVGQEHVSTKEKLYGEDASSPFTVHVAVSLVVKLGDPAHVNAEEV